MQSILSFLRRDARHFQLLWLSSFLCYGLLVLGWESELPRYLTLATTALLTQLAGQLYVHFRAGEPLRFTARDWLSLKSAGVTTLGLSLLCHTHLWWVAVLAAFVAIGSKFVIRAGGKHIFNPANLGLAAAILLTGEAWVSPGQWGSGAMLVFLIGSCGAVVVLRVGRLDTPLAFLATFGGLLFLRQVVYLDWPVDHWLHQMANGSLLLFTFFMITDPMTIPNARLVRVLWAACVGVLAYFLAVKLFVNAAPVWALLILTPAVPLLDWARKGRKYEWMSKETAR